MSKGPRPAPLVGLLLLDLVLSAQTGSFSIRDLGTLGGSSSLAYGVNDAGDVVGESWLPGGIPGMHAFLWRGGAMIDIGTLGGRSDSIAFDINNLGQVVGYSYQMPGDVSQPFVWHNGMMTELPLLPGHRWGSAFAVNDSGEVVGNSEGQAVLWINGVATPLIVPNGIESGARGINNRGEIVGYTRRTDAPTPHAQAVIWENGIARMLGVPIREGCATGDCALTMSSVASAINEAGMISGSASGPDEITYAVRWVNGRGTALPLLPGSSGSQANTGSINAGGDVVGYSDVLRNEAFTQVGTFWPAGGGVQELPPLSTSGVSSLGMAISNAGHVVGGASASALDFHAVLWTTMAPADRTPPTITLEADAGGILWPPRSRLVRVTFRGSVTDTGSGVDAVTFDVEDEYGRVQPSGTVAISNGRFVLRINLEASREGNDRDGRRYTLRVAAVDHAGNRSVAAVPVLVPHDRRRVE